MSGRTRYFLFQVPGWIAVAGLVLWLDLPTRLGVGATVAVIVIWIAKDVLLYPLLRVGYEADVKTGTAALIGLQGTAHEQLNPAGYVKLRGELWRAELAPGEAPIPAGAPLRVVTAAGLTLVVRRAETTGAAPRD